MADNPGQNRKMNEVVGWKEWKVKKREEAQKWKELRKQKKLRKILEGKKKQSQPNGTIEVDAVDDIQAGRHYTISIALPGSILDNAQSPELKTYLAGQVARAASVFNVNEVVVFDESGKTSQMEILDDESLKLHKKNNGCRQLVRILQYLECPQYLRKYFFPLHNDLEYAGLLNPLDIPHHLRADEDSKYREGVVMNKPVKDGKGSFVYIGLRKTAIIDKVLLPNIRVTVRLDDQQPLKKHLKGVAVSPSAPCKKDGLYWGYSIRLASSFGAVLSECPYKEGYDRVIGTSDKGSSIDSLSLPTFNHLMIVFGGLKGLEYCLEVDEALDVDDPSLIFQHYLNTCPSQGSRTIRTEEAILITLAALRPTILKCQESDRV